jgi:pyridoxine 4-dehydrogenase
LFIGPRTFSIGGDLTVHRLGYGGMALTGPGGWGQARDPAAAREVLRHAVELGVQLLDTADSYGPNVSEECIRDALHPYEPGLVIATKGGLIRTAPWQMHANGHPDHLQATCEESMRRLGLERIDLYQLHAVDSAVPLEESVGALADLRAAGKVRHIGLSNVTVKQIEAARRIVPVASIQNRYSLAARGAEDQVVDYCAREGIAYLPWQPLAKGSLARARSALASVARRHDVSPAQIALAWLLARSPTIIPIPGTLSVSHLEQNVRAGSLELTPEDLRELDGYRLSTLDARSLARRFVPPRLRRLAVTALRARAALRK